MLLSRKVRLEHWHPQLVKGEAAFVTLLRDWLEITRQDRMTVKMIIVMVDIEYCCQIERRNNLY